MIASAWRAGRPPRGYLGVACTGLSGGSAQAADLFACVVGGLTRAVKNEAKCILLKAGVQQLPLRGGPLVAGRSRKVRRDNNYGA